MDHGQPTSHTFPAEKWKNQNETFALALLTKFRIRFDPPQRSDRPPPCQPLQDCCLAPGEGGKQEEESMWAGSQSCVPGLSGSTGASSRPPCHSGTPPSCRHGQEEALKGHAEKILSFNE